MKIKEAVQRMKQYHKGTFMGRAISEEQTRDKILFGDSEQELRGIVTTCFASVDVIKKAIELGANLIICHEALFWNHGDRQDFIRDFPTYNEKIELLKKIES